MLAEPRRKVRYSLNHNGLEWREDNTGNVGKKMLAQMGWSEGSGLGANEQGMTAPIQLSLKSDLKGVGFKDLSPGDMLNARMNPFHNVLDHLKQCQKEESGDSSTSSSSDNEDSVSDADKNATSLKKPPSYSRVRHHRRIQVKDLSRRSQEEMRCIVGTATAAQPAVKKETKKRKLQTEEETVSSEDKSEPSHKDHGVNTHVNKLSVADYFKEKMAAMKAKLNSTANTTEEVSSIAQTSEEEETPRKRKREKKVKFEEEVRVEEYEVDAPLDEEYTFDVVTESVDESFVEDVKPSKRKKAKKSKHQVKVTSEEQTQEEKYEEEVTVEEFEVEKMDNFAEGVKDVNPKNKKREAKKAKQQDDVMTEDTEILTVEEQPQKVKCEDEVEVDVQLNDEMDQFTADDFTEDVKDVKTRDKKKKTKKAKHQEEVTTEDTELPSVKEQPQQQFENAVRSKKKSKKSKGNEEESDTVERIPANVIFSSPIVKSIPGYQYY